jgi:hypothetical protein
MRVFLYATLRLHVLVQSRRRVPDQEARGAVHLGCERGRTLDAGRQLARGTARHARAVSA